MILLLSLLLRLIAFVWSIVLMRKLREWRMGFLTAMIALMALRQGLTLVRRVQEDAWSLSPADVSLDELPGLAVSVLAWLAVVYLGRMFTSLDRANAELRFQDEQLRQAQKMEALGNLAGRTAHDFNNLLTVIIGSSELARMELEEDHPSQEYFDELEAASQRAQDLTRQILTFSRKQVVDPVVFEVNGAILELDGMLRRLLGTDVELVVVPCAEELFVRVDRSQFEQVVLNLVVNARDAMPAGGTISLRTGLEVPLPDDHPDDSPTPRAVLLVEDTGGGMSDEARLRAFEPFYTTKPLGKGTGLGLSTCLGIVERNGGSIEVVDSTSAGTRIRVSIPVADRAEGERVTPTPPERDAGGNECVWSSKTRPSSGSSRSSPSSAGDTR